jgi:hypothetical protein
MDEPEVALADLTRARRQRRVADADWFELLYRAYLTVIACGMAVLVAASFVGDDPVSASAMDRVGREAPALVGIALAAALVIGARSGARGGPLALEGAYVQHVLLSPLDRDHAMRGPARKLLIQGTISGGVAGGMIGLVAGERLTSGTAGLVAGGAAAGAATAIGALGAAMLVAGLRLRMLVVDAFAIALGALVYVDVSQHTRYSPTTWLGDLAVSAVESRPVTAAAGVVVALALGALGLLKVGDTSLEASLRRAGLVSSLRFAVTRQDLRTVVLLQRRLAQDRSRATPWLPFVPPGPWPEWRRDWRGLLRLPARRYARMAVLGAAAVACAWAAWDGTVALIAVAGLALHAVALDAVEPLAQELDHPTLWGSYPSEPGRHLLKHLAAPATLLLVAAIPVCIAVGAWRGAAAGTIAAVTAVSGSIGAVVGAASTIATPPFDPASGGGAFAPAPETVGMQVVFRLAWPIAVTIISLLPLLAGRAGLHQGEDPAQSAAGVLPFMALPIGAAATWLNMRKPVKL